MLERYDIYLMERYGELLKEVENYFPVKKKELWTHVKCRLGPAIQTFD